MERENDRLQGRRHGPQCWEENVSSMKQVRFWRPCRGAERREGAQLARMDRIWITETDNSETPVHSNLL